MNSYSLKQKILFSVVVALSLVIGLLSWQSYSSQKSQLLKNSLEQVQRLGEQQAERIQEWLAGRQDIMGALASKVEGDSLNTLQQAQASGRFQF